MTAATSQPCPQCDGTLCERVVAGIHIDVCDQCRGVWFDAGELKDYRRHHGYRGLPSPVLVTYGEKGPRRTCPVCQGDSLAERSVAHRPVLHCARCAGLFLPDAELRALIGKEDDSWSFGDLSGVGDLLMIPLELVGAILSP